MIPSDPFMTLAEGDREYADWLFDVDALTRVTLDASLDEILDADDYPLELWYAARATPTEAVDLISEGVGT